MTRHFIRLALVLLLAFTAGGLAWLDTAAAGVPVGACHDANTLHDHDDSDDHCVHAASRARGASEFAAQPLPQRPAAAIPAEPPSVTPPPYPATGPHRSLRDARPLEPPQLRALAVTRLLI